MLLLCRRGLYAMERGLLSPKWIFIINAFLFLLHVSIAKTLESINWDKRILQSHPGGLMINASINDVVDIVCPKTTSAPDQQFHKFTQVTKRAYEACNLTVSRPEQVRTLLHCNRPALVNEYRLYFQMHTGYPGDPTFEHGMDYYFITTSDGTARGINQASGGLCETHNMKLKIHVIGDPPTGIPSSSTESTPPVHRPDPPTTPTPQRRITSPTTQVATTVKPTRRKPTTKKTPSRNGENDSLKDGDNRSSTLRHSSLLLLLSSTVAFVRWLRW